MQGKRGGGTQGGQDKDGGRGVVVSLQICARPWNMSPTVRSGVIARRGASGDQCAVPLTTSRNTEPYISSSSSPSPSTPGRESEE